eukprot:7016852-Lingulodinium_polyedra.AAC.1
MAGRCTDPVGRRHIPLGLLAQHHGLGGSDAPQNLPLRCGLLGPYIDRPSPLQQTTALGPPPWRTRTAGR